jgi:Mg2+-importing ATPase
MIGIAIPLSPLVHTLGFTRLPAGFFLALGGPVIGYLVLIEVAKNLFFADPEGRLPSVRRRDHAHHIQRRAARFSHPGPLRGDRSR